MPHLSVSPPVRWQVWWKGKHRICAAAPRAGPPSAVTGRHWANLKESSTPTAGLKNNHVSVLAGDVSWETDERQLLRGWGVSFEHVPDLARKWDCILMPFWVMLLQECSCVAKNGVRILLITDVCWSQLADIKHIDDPATGKPFRVLGWVQTRGKDVENFLKSPIIM